MIRSIVNVDAGKLSVRTVAEYFRPSRTQYDGDVGRIHFAEPIGLDPDIERGRSGNRGSFRGSERACCEEVQQREYDGQLCPVGNCRTYPEADSAAPAGRTFFNRYPGVKTPG